MTKLRFGILSTAHVNNFAFLPMVGKIDSLELDAVASRSADAARRYAEKHGIPKAYGDYDSLIADPNIDCVYISLPNSMHKEWTIKALDAGKHVLCEKPMSANEAEAREIADKVKSTGLIFSEAFHYRYHPLAERLENIVRSGGIGAVREVSSVFSNRIRDRNNAQMSPKLAGGALLDTGCYPVSLCRWIAGCDDARVVRAHSTINEGGVDGTTFATLKFANGVVGNILCSIDLPFLVSAYIRGDKGSIFINMPYCPAWQKGDVISDVYLFLVRRGLRIDNIRVPTITTYHCQLQAFCNAVLAGKQTITDAGQGVLNMRLIDAIFERSGGRKNW
jgi:predicted dehydrogenase